MTLLSIDPGENTSSWVLYDEKNHIPIKFAKEDNEIILSKLSEFRKKTDTLILGILKPYGMPISTSKMNSYIWIGKFWGVFGGNVELIDKEEIKRFFFGRETVGVNNTSIYKKIIKRYGKDKKEATGNKTNPGVLFGINLEIALALSLLIVFTERK